MHFHLKPIEMNQVWSRYPAVPKQHVQFFSQVTSKNEKKKESTSCRK